MQNSPEIAAEYRGVRVPASDRMNDVRIRRINEGRYEGDELAGALKHIKSGDRVMELGAGIGFVGGAIAKLCDGATVRSYEANPNLIDDINALYDANDLGDRIKVRNAVVVSDPARPASMRFRVHKRSYLGSSLLLSDGMMADEVDVPTVGFDEIQRDFNPNVLVMDIEGGELEFLRFADLSQVDTVIIEFHPGVYTKEGMRECKSILRDAGLEPDEEVSTRKVWSACRTA